MKILVILLMSLFITSCMIAPYQAEPLRKAHPALSELDNIEMLLQNEESQYLETRQIASGDNISLGMQMKKVKLNLGTPMTVEIAGNPKYGNERWIYEKEIPTMNGYYKEKKVIYFEGGSVVGWESH
jgi:outer membrane protein assembly factor BamE (lipoprotein component of BamABCDE complex)